MLKIGKVIETVLTSPWLTGHEAPKLHESGSGKLNGTKKKDLKYMLDAIVENFYLVNQKWLRILCLSIYLYLQLKLII